MKISNEAKIGIIGIVTILVLIWGINYLKGKNILNSDVTLYTYYSDANGLEPYASVYIKGYKIGLIEEVEYLSSSNPPIKVTMSIENKYKIPQNSVAELFSADLLGTKAIRIDLSDSDKFLGNDDTIASRYLPDMLSSLKDDLTPLLSNLNNLTITLDSAGNHLNTLLGSEKLEESISNINEATENLSESLKEGGDLHKSFRNFESITSNLEEKNEAVSASIENMKSITESVNGLTQDSLFYHLSLLTENLSDIVSQVKTGSGSLGQLIYNDSLYLNLESLTRDLNLLIVDLKENPGDYVQVSVFGKSKKE